jgi:ferredoxin
MTALRVEFLRPDGSVESAASMAPGGELVDACDASNAPVDFSCRSACCTTCRVRVVAGGEALAEPGGMEHELLRAVKAPADVRFACVARAADAPPVGVVLKLQPLGPCD